MAGASTPAPPLHPVPHAAPPVTPAGPPGPEETSPVFFLAILYCLIASFIAVQLIRFVYYRHKVRSFQFAFLVFLLLWDVLRGVYFLFIENFLNVGWLNALMYWVPTNIQFATFSLLLVFYAQLFHEHKAQWRTFKNRYLVGWAVSNLLLLALALVWWGFGLGHDEVPEWLNSTHAVFSGVLFFLLVCILAWHGVRVANLMRHTEFGGARGQTKRVARLSFRQILFVTIFLFACFTSRCIYDFLSAANAVHLNFTGDAHGMVGWWVMIAFSAWEVIPCVLVLVLFGRVQPTNLGGFGRSKPEAQAVINDTRRGDYSAPASELDDDEYPPSTYTRPSDAERRRRPQATDALLRTSLFSDPNRYDSSDNDVSPFQPDSAGFSPMFYGSGGAAASPYSNLRNVA